MRQDQAQKPGPRFSRARRMECDKGRQGCSSRRRSACPPRESPTGRGPEKAEEAEALRRPAPGWPSALLQPTRRRHGNRGQRNRTSDPSEVLRQRACASGAATVIGLPRGVGGAQSDPPTSPSRVRGHVGGGKVKLHLL